MLLCMFMRLLLALVLGWLSTALTASAAVAVSAATAPPPRSGVPDWLYPLNPPAPTQVAPDDAKPIHVPDSDVAFTAAQLFNLFSVPDWHPQAHAPMPDVVAHGRPPKVFACGYCHMPRGQGRPENAPLAGLPAQYIIQQVEDFKSGARRGAVRTGYLPTDGMVRVAENVTAEDLKAAADYFAAQRMTKRTRVVETARVPQMKDVGWMYTSQAGSATEPLGQRLLEMTPDLAAHEHRADGEIYIAYVPTGSLKRGKSLAATCVACHGARLQGVGLVPPLAGRLPTYLVRQLVAFKTGARAGRTGEPMKAVVANLDVNKMIDVAAYAAWLNP